MRLNEKQQKAVRHVISRRRIAKKSTKTRPAVVVDQVASGESLLDFLDGKVIRAGSMEQSEKVITIGAVSVRADAPVKAQVKRNIAEGQDALRRVRKTFLTSGVELGSSDNVPLFHADPSVPDQIIRILNGKKESGKIINGKFKVVSR